MEPPFSTMPLEETAGGTLASRVYGPLMDFDQELGMIIFDQPSHSFQHLKLVVFHVYLHKIHLTHLNP
jgi:hypothetical protein